MLLAASLRVQSRGHGQDSASAMELAKQMQREAATAELQVTLAGNLKDFSIAAGAASSQATQRAQQSQIAVTAAAYREALKNSPDDAELHFDLSLALAKLGDSSDAQAELQSAIRLDPNMAKARNQLGIWHLVNNEKAKAEGEFTAAISEDSQFVEPKNNLGVLYACAGKDLGAIELFPCGDSRAARLPPGARKPWPGSGFKRQVRRSQAWPRRRGHRNLAKGVAGSARLRNRSAESRLRPLG